MMVRIVYEGGTGEIEVKKSRFIATVKPVHTEQEALEFIAAVRKQYWNATHNCYAYIIGENPGLMRCSDDGEPQGTAGRPMLDVLSGSHIVDAVVVVTRYFGGTLLGTGGLVRAYGAAVTQGLAACSVLTKREGFHLLLQSDYNDLGKLQYLLAQRGLSVTDTVYENNVSLKVLVPAEDLQAVKDDITEATSARTVFLEEEAVCFAEGKKKPVLLQ